MMDDRIYVDRMRYTKNTSSSRLVLLAIVFNVLYFISIYKLDIYEPLIVAGNSRLNNVYFTMMLGGSVILNLVFMLVAFLASEGVKNYKKGYSKLLIVLALIQIARIFIFPNIFHNTPLYVNEKRWYTTVENYTIPILNIQVTYNQKVTFMSTWQYIRDCFYLLASAFCLFRSARINSKKSSALAAHIANIESLQA